ncbi:hypothetical protein A3194_14260 [Candidatus Thiodiazotropha endoloripes]|uniref:hypothetical protein n=1 Tax=Candidatus Thiodiazotropha endoloripes TaxID=1818881 RepID=UPI00083DB780|nr:hypothetical protein [Candidatus Thiodiazotropha endoloripes]ODB84921.1 hypothetical protein A3194_14260 [Candidatus Thiodiazotropha endoloripes]
MNKIISHLITHTIITLTVIISMTNISRADDAFFGSEYNDRINIRLSGFRALTSTEIEVDSEQGVIGEELSF